MYGYSSIGSTSIGGLLDLHVNIISLTKDLKYTIIISNPSTKDLRYKIQNIIPTTKNLLYIVIAPNVRYKDLKYTIVAPNQLTKDLGYKIHNIVPITKNLTYELIKSNLSQKNLNYKIVISRLISGGSKELEAISTYGAMTYGGLATELNYPNNVKNLKYMLRAPISVNLGLRYTIRSNRPTGILIINGSTGLVI